MQKYYLDTYCLIFLYIFTTLLIVAEMLKIVLCAFHACAKLPFLQLWSSPRLHAKFQKHNFSANVIESWHEISFLNLPGVLLPFTSLKLSIS